MEKPPSYPFYNEEEIKQKGKRWKEEANNFNYDHSEHRIEGREEKNYDIAYLHMISFIKDVIPKLIEEKKKSGKKVKILDVGAGSAEYADQIRQEFGNDVEVVTTGLSKSKVQDYRSKNNKTPLLPEDLRLNSIFQMSDYPEFDLIIDTFGEQYYITEQTKLSDSDIMMRNGIEPEMFPIFKRYVLAVTTKLNSGGQASIYPVSFNDPESCSLFEELVDEMNKQGIEITESYKVLKIKKQKFKY